MSSAHPHPVTWIVVADGGQAHIYARRDTEHHIPMPGNAHHPHFRDTVAQELVPVMEMQVESDKVYDIDPSQLGSVHESGSSSRHRIQPRVDVHEEVKKRFMQRIAAELRAAWDKQFFGQLVLVAPPHMLGELRAALDEHVAAAVIAELPKDFTKYAGKELTERLKDIA